jgi:DNA-binding HxlR family transcriptional regulator
MGHISGDYCRSCTETIHIVQGKWKINILCSMRSGPVRLGQLRRELRMSLPRNELAPGKRLS